MPSPAHDALKWRILLEHHIPVEREVIAWADKQVEATDVPPAPLLELASTPADHTADILSHLNQVAGGDFWTSFRAAMPHVHQHLVAHPEAAERIAAEFYQTAVKADDVPEAFLFLYHFDDAFSLAHRQIYGQPDGVRREFIHEIAHFTSAA